MILRNILTTDRQTDRQDKSVLFCCVNFIEPLQGARPVHGFAVGGTRPLPAFPQANAKERMVET